MKAFTSFDTITSTSKNALLHHPLAFPKNLKNGQSALTSGDYATAGDLLGADLAFMIAEL